MKTYSNAYFTGNGLPSAAAALRRLMLASCSSVVVETMGIGARLADAGAGVGLGADAGDQSSVSGASSPSSFGKNQSAYVMSSSDNII